MVKNHKKEFNFKFDPYNVYDKKAPHPRKDDLYRLPWSKNEHGTGWLEITTCCNMACPGCYRGCNRKETDEKPEHYSLEQIKKDVIYLKEIKNCHTISISGGEPLMHPKIVEIVKFIKDNDMEPFILTNGTLITKDLLQKLKGNGAVGLIIRVDSLRINRKQNEEELNKLRQKYVDMFRDVGGLFLGFTAVVGKQNLKEIKHIFKLGHSNPNVVNMITLILMRQYFSSKKEKLDTTNWIETGDLCEEIYKNYPELKFSAYLGSHHENLRLRWLYSFWLNLGTEILGYLDSKAVELAQITYHLKTGKYFYVRPKKDYYLSILKVFGISLFDKSFRKMLGRFFLKILKNPKYLFKKASLQQLFILRPAGFFEGKRDICDDCPCLMLYKGKLVPSCVLDEWKALGGKYRELDDKELKEYKKKWGV